MGETESSADHVLAELLDMGFEFYKASEALEATGPFLKDAVEFILNGFCCSSTHGESENTFTCLKGQNSSLGEDADSLCRMKQPHITKHFPSFSKCRKDISISSSKPSFCGIRIANSRPPDEDERACVPRNNNLKVEHEPSHIDSSSHMIPKKQNESFQYEQLPQLNKTDGQGIMLHWEQRIGDTLQKHFGFSSLKDFQKEAIESWLAQKDCLIIAATGSGKSLCFQIPALLSGKIVVVISPLISLMHDQCLKLANHGISACFLGSGQSDSTVEQKAMNGVYRIVYVCPETILRLLEPLKKLVENNRIALFAIDEVHCVSKWGHDFRPDYRRLSALRENFSKSHIRSLRHDIPLMALTATATPSVREDIRKALLMSNDTKVILTSFFRSNLRFSVKHSRTSCVSSYENDFRDLVLFYTSSRTFNNFEKNNCVNYTGYSSNCSTSSSDVFSDEERTSESYNCSYDDNHSCRSLVDEDYILPRGDQLTVEYLENELDMPCSANDLDVSCAEFLESGPPKKSELFTVTQAPNPFEPLEDGPTIIYVPTRNETMKLAEYFCRSNVQAAAYHAKLPKAQLRRVHENFHQNIIDVVVATIAFGMGIDKSNVRRVIHYGWPQSLEAYYQEAGRAGRDGKLSDCILYANFLRVPTLLPSKRSEEQTRQAHNMLTDCFRYGITTTTCRAKTLVKYFGEEFGDYGCSLCDICLNGPPPKQNLTDEVNVFLQTLKAQCAYMDETSLEFVPHIGAIFSESTRNVLLKRPNIRDVVIRIREQHPKFVAIDQVRWRGLARILQDMGFIEEADDWVRVSIKFPQITKLGMEFLSSHDGGAFYAYPYADMLLSSTDDKPYSSFSEWGKGWADPLIRARRLRGRRSRTKKTREGKSKKRRRNCKKPSTARGRLAAKLSNFKRERIMEYKDESQRIEQNSRLYGSSMPSDSFELDASHLLQELGGISTAMDREKFIFQELMGEVKSMMWNTEVAVRSYMILRTRFLRPNASSISDNVSASNALAGVVTSSPLNQVSSTYSMPPYDFYSGFPKRPSPYMQHSLARFEKYIAECSQWVEELEQLLLLDNEKNTFSSGSSSLQSLPNIMSNVHEFFVHVAAKVESLHQYIESLKKAYLADQRRRGDANDPFLEADRRETAKMEAAARRIHPTLHLPAVSAQPSNQGTGLYSSSMVPLSSAPMQTVGSSGPAGGFSLFGTPSSALTSTTSSLVFSTPTASAPASGFFGLSGFSPQPSSGTASTSLFGSSQPSSFGASVPSFTSTPASGSSTLFGTPTLTLGTATASGASFGTAAKSARPKSRTSRR